MGSFSFGISELIKESVDGWYKLLSAVRISFQIFIEKNFKEEGEFYNIKIPPEDEDEVESLRKKMQDMQSSREKRPKNRSTNSLISQQTRDAIKASDFNFLTVLGKGSFGKVN